MIWNILVIFIIQKGGTMENSNFKMLTSNEIMEINGGIALTTAIAVGLNRKNRK